MKVDAVQNERDLIGKRPRTHSFTQPQNTNNGSPPQSFASVSPINSVVGSAPANNHFYGMDNQPVVSDPNMWVLLTVAFFIDMFSVANSRRSSVVGSNDPWDSPKQLLDLLMKSEEKIKNLRDSVIKETGRFEYTIKREPHVGRKATHNDILHSLHSQLLLVIEWAKTLKPFGELCTEDQTALLKNFASQHIVMCVAYRSINSSGFLQLINDTCIPRVNNTESNGEDEFYKKDCDRIM